MWHAGKLVRAAATAAAGSEQVMMQPWLGFKHAQPAVWQSLAYAWPDGSDWECIQCSKAAQHLVHLGR